MPEELESGSGSIDLDSGGQDVGGAAPAEEPQGTQGGGETQSEFVTRQMLEEVMGGWSSSQQERLDKAMSQFGGLHDIMKQVLESQKPKPPELIPGPKELEGIDAHGMHSLLKSLAEKHDMTVKELKDKMSSMEHNWKVQTETERVHGHLKNLGNEVAKQFPVFATPQGRKLLDNQIIAELYNNGNDIRKLNVFGIGQALNAMVDSETKARMASAAKVAAGAGQPTTTSPAKNAPKAPPKGAPSRPSPNPGSGMTMKNFKEAQRDFILKHFPSSD